MVNLASELSAKSTSRTPNKRRLGTAENRAGDPRPPASEGLTAVYMRSATDDSASLNRQLNDCAEYCREKLGNYPDLLFCDQAKSGRVVERVGLEKLIQAVKSGQVASIVVSDVDRLSRQLLCTVMLLELLRENGVTLHCVGRGGPISAGRSARPTLVRPPPRPAVLQSLRTGKDLEIDRKSKG
jgi:predicted site-specific integrase-resolvase